MAVSKTNRMQRKALSAALMSALILTANAAAAQDTQQGSEEKKATELDKVVVTGSLIPQSELETFKPVTVISAEDLRNRGFNTVQEALAQSSFATGGVQGNQTSASFTQGAETNSLFGLPPGYTKYLIDGRPMANYPALYNGSDVFNNISGIPVDLVERIEILPGGQSSLYGSDAIAGVVNVILKKKVEGTVVSGRAGVYTDGGGQSTRLSIADSFHSSDERFNILLGAQYEHRDPIWGYDRDLTKQFNQHALNGAPPVASRDWLVIGYYTSYNFLDPDNCANVASAFGGTTGVQTRPNRPAPYCGSMFTPGYKTVKNGKEGYQVYSHATFDLSDNTQLYGDVLYSDESVDYHVGSNFTWWGTTVKWGYYYDPNLGDFMNLQRAFAPEDFAGGWEQSMNHDDSKSYAVTLGVNGTFGQSNWDYDFGLTRTEYKLTESGWNRLADPINNWFEQNILGPNLNPTWDQPGNPFPYAVYTPDYAAFYHLLPTGVMESFTTTTHSHSKTYDNLFRAQVTNASLFGLPGGDVGLAVAVEAAKEGWEYNPDALLIPDPVTLESQIWGTTSISGEGDRKRYAVTGEMRLPLFEPLTVSVSSRYDAYKAEGETIDKPTYSLGIEYRPIESLLFRGKYGTAFRAPTLADQFQGLSGFYSQTTDYLNCYRAGFDPSNIDACPANIADAQYFGQQAGNPDLEPINADVWSAGVVWAPTGKFSMGLDYFHWDIEDEVTTQSVSGLLLDELNCTPVADGGTGALDPNSGTCQAAFNQIRRSGPGDTIDSIFITKINVSKRVLNALTFDLHYLQEMGSWGDLKFDGSWTRNLKHEQQVFPTDPVIDLIDNPFYSTDPDYKANASVAWAKNKWTTTLYANYIGPTPNNVASINEAGYDAPNGRDLGSYTTFNASVNFEPTDDLRFSFLVTNLGNRMPDMDLTYSGLTGEPYNSSNFDVYGRAYYAEVRYVFNKD